MTEETKCGKCGLPIHPSESGIRYFGLFTAHSEGRCTQLLRLEITRLRAALDARDAELLAESRAHDETFKETEDFAFLKAKVTAVTRHVADGKHIHVESQFDSLMDDVRELAKVVNAPSSVLATAREQLRQAKVQLDARGEAIKVAEEALRVMVSPVAHSPGCLFLERRGLPCQCGFNNRINAGMEKARAALAHLAALAAAKEGKTNEL